MTYVSAPPTVALSRSREPAKTLREKGEDSFHAALAAILTAGLEAALEAGDHPRAISFINRGFAEGRPQLGCDLLYRAIAVVGAARTWTVQLAPLACAPQQSGPLGDQRSSLNLTGEVAEAGGPQETVRTGKDRTPTSAG
ncbi:hypothetical protein [Actinoplanes subtropicus]|uniref:hypothetical protein n=1 Tax=Actinoplanes subtropicus TaxID=543632 RepID=UPI0012F79614|nr:hypothetical protein [Actinoplanes subtropicus]